MEITYMHLHLSQLSCSIFILSHTHELFISQRHIQYFRDIIVLIVDLVTKETRFGAASERKFEIRTNRDI